MHKFLFIFFLLPGVFFWSADSYAEAVCQVLSKSGSRLDLNVEMLGKTTKVKPEKLKALLWLDPALPEQAVFQALVQFKLSQLFGDFEQNPLTIGMLANFLDQEMTFKSERITRIKAENSLLVSGRLFSKLKAIPAKFKISVNNLGKEDSRFSGNLESKDFSEVVGISGKAMAKFDLVFQADRKFSKESCIL